MIPNTDDENDRLDVQKLYGACLRQKGDQVSEPTDARSVPVLGLAQPVESDDNVVGPRSSGTKASSDTAAVRSTVPEKRSAEIHSARVDSVKKRRTAHSATLASMWTGNVELLSVKGYHNTGAEDEL